jgi:GTPase SAR1 family protein
MDDFSENWAKSEEKNEPLKIDPADSDAMKPKELDLDIDYSPEPESTRPEVNQQNDCVVTHDLDSKTEEKIITIPTITLFGKLGVGKTTLFNKLTGSRCETGSREQSVTQSTTSQITLNKEMFLIDTPGQDTHKDVMKHANEIVAALESIPLNGIIIVEEIARIGTLYARIQSSMDILGSNQHLVSIIVTKTDIMPDYNSNNATIDLAKLLAIDSNRIMFIGNMTDPSCILQFLKSRILPSQIIDLTEEQKQMLIAMNPTIKKCNQELKEMDEKFEAVRKYVTTSFQHDDSLILNLTTWLTDFRDKEKQTLFQSVEEEDEDQKILLYGKIVIRLNNGLDNLIHFLNQHLIYYRHLINFDEYRACPFCKTVWVKVEGCDDFTTCGTRPNKSIDHYTYMGYQFAFTKREELWTLTVDTSDIKKCNDNGQYIRRRAYGCGERIAWTSMLCVNKNIFKDFTNQISQVYIKGKRTPTEKRVSKLFAKCPQFIHDTKRKIRDQVYTLGALKTLCIRESPTPAAVVAIHVATEE